MEVLPPWGFLWLQHNDFELTKQTATEFFFIISVSIHAFTCPNISAVVPPSALYLVRNLPCVVLNWFQAWSNRWLRGWKRFMSSVSPLSLLFRRTSTRRPEGKLSGFVTHPDAIYHSVWNTGHQIHTWFGGCKLKKILLSLLKVV